MIRDGLDCVLDAIAARVVVELDPLIESLLRDGVTAARLRDDLRWVRDAIDDDLSARFADATSYPIEIA